MYKPLWATEPTLGSRIFCWCGIVANALLILWCATWIWQYRNNSSIHSRWLFATVFAAVYLADLMSGFVHWLTDTWFSEVSLNGALTRVVSIAREHHLYPLQIVGYGFRDYTAYSSWPSVTIVGPIALILTLVLNPSPAVFEGVVACFVISGIMLFGTYAHRLGHRQSPWLAIRALQHCRCLITPSYHAVHHHGNHDIRYCVINGWANPLCDRVGLWRSLEWVIHRITGISPRQNDREWFDRFERDPDFESRRRNVTVDTVDS